MLTNLFYLFLALFLSAILYPFWINFVYKFHMGEEIRTDGPRTHLTKKGTPTMGGLIFIFVVAIITFALNKSRTQTLFPVFVAAMVGLFGIIEDFSKIYRSVGLRAPSKIFEVLKKPFNWFINFWDTVGSNDEIGLKTYQKILIQAVVGSFVAFWSYFKLGWDYIWLPLVGDIHIGFLYPIVIFLLFIIVLNSVAFTDGLDGLAGGLGVIAFLAFWVIASALNYNSLAGFAATFVGALLPFLYFNVHPARIFMGNVGSHVLGATLVVLAVVMHREVAMVLILLMFLIDGASSPLQQLSVKLTGKRLFRMAPIHHHFELLGWSEAKVTLRFWILGAMFAFAGILVALL